MLSQEERSQRVTGLANDYERKTRHSYSKAFKCIKPFIPDVTTSSTIHDNACGPGTATFGILRSLPEDYPKPSIYATDTSDAMLASLNSMARVNGWSDSISTYRCDSTDLSPCLSSNSCTHSITNFGVASFDDPPSALKEIYRVLKKGGTAVLTCWRDHRALQLVQATQRAIRPNLPMFMANDGNKRFEKDYASLLQDAGFNAKNIKAHVVRDISETEDLDDLVEFISGGMGQMAMKGFNADDRAKWPSTLVTNLTQEERASGKIKLEVLVVCAMK